MLRGCGRLVVLVGAAAVAVRAVALLLRLGQLVTGALGLFAAEYAVYLIHYAEEVDVASPAVAVGALVAAELAHASLEPQAGRSDRGLLAFRAGVFAATAIGSAAAALVLLDATAFVSSRSLALQAVGVAAAAGAVALLAALAWRARA